MLAKQPGNADSNFRELTELIISSGKMIKRNTPCPIFDIKDESSHSVVVLNGFLYEINEYLCKEVADNIIYLGFLHLLL